MRSASAAAALALLLALAAAHSAAAAGGAPRRALRGSASFPSRLLLQQSVSTSTPVNIFTPAPQPAVQSAGFIGDLLDKKAPAAPQAASIPTVVVAQPTPQVASLPLGPSSPTTLGGPLTLRTNTPVTVSSPIEVSTPVKQTNFQTAKQSPFTSGSPVVQAKALAAAVVSALASALTAAAVLLPPLPPFPLG